MIKIKCVTYWKKFYLINILVYFSEDGTWNSLKNLSINGKKLQYEFDTIYEAKKMAEYLNKYLIFR